MARHAQIDNSILTRKTVAQASRRAKIGSVTVMQITGTVL